MKPTNLANGRLLLILLTAGLTIGLISWDFKYVPGQYQQIVTDTAPKKKSNERDKKIRDLDDALVELDGVKIEMDMQKIQKEIAEAMKGLDIEKIKLGMTKAMKEVDLAKIMKDVEQTMSSINIEKMSDQMAKANVEMTRAFKEVDLAAIQKDVKASLEKIDWKEMKEELAKIKDINFKEIQDEMLKVQLEMKELGPKIAKEMEDAKVQIEKAKVEMREYKDFVDGLDKDGLISKKENYTLKHKDGELLINGKKASEQVYSKYRAFLDKHKNFTIEKSDDDFNINVD